MKDLLRALAVLAEPPPAADDGGSARLAGALDLPDPPPAWQHTALFGSQLYPYASVYLGDEGKLGGEARDRVAGFWRALGEAPPAEPDHLAALLGLLARLQELEEDAAGSRREAWRRAQAALVAEHLTPWLVPWLARLGEIAPTFYRAWGVLLGDTLEQLSRQLPLPTGLPVALQQAAETPVPERLGGQDFLDALLSPVRTGTILVRDDLARAAGELGMALRVGERRWVLTAFLQQEPGRALDWLATEARRQADVLEAPGRDVVRDFWVGRARRTATILEDAARAATDDQARAVGAGDSMPS